MILLYNVPTIILITGNSTVSCFETVVPGNLPSPSSFHNATYIGEEVFGCYNVNKWQTVASNPIASLYYFTTIDTGVFLGFATNDYSQTGYFLDMKEVENSEKAFTRPNVIPNFTF